MSDNIHYLHEPVSIKLKRDKNNMEKLEAIFASRPELGVDTDDFERFKVSKLCKDASEMLEDVVILGSTSDGTVKMMTTQDDVADVLFYLEVAKKTILENTRISDDPPF